MKHTTDIYNINANSIRSEKLCTLLDYVKMGRLKPGQELFIGEIKEKDGVEVSFNIETIWIGHAVMQLFFTNHLKTMEKLDGIMIILE